MPKEVIKKIISMPHPQHGHTWHGSVRRTHKSSIIHSLLLRGGHMFHEEVEKSGSHHSHRPAKPKTLDE